MEKIVLFGIRTLSRPRAGQVDSYQLQHGDMLYMVPLSEDLFPAAAASAAPAAEAMETQSEPESKASSTAGAGAAVVAWARVDLAPWLCSALPG